MVERVAALLSLQPLAIPFIQMFCIVVYISRLQPGLWMNKGVTVSSASNLTSGIMGFCLYQRLFSLRTEVFHNCHQGHWYNGLLFQQSLASPFRSYLPKPRCLPCDDSSLLKYHHSLISYTTITNLQIQRCLCLS